MGARAGVGALGVVLLAILVFLAVSSWSRQPAVAKASIQPINFPHNTHVQTYKLDCQYCHSDARRSEYAGLPSVTRCLGCHKITAADRPEIKKLGEYLAKGEPIPWVRVNKLPEFTYFPHKAHLRAKLTCQECHGAVETMTTFAAETGRTLTNDLLNLVGLRPAARPLTMGWCVDCHRRQNATAGMHAPLDCVTCHH
ncbi:MAG: menaquinol oxidoreductase [Candidatus Rokuibacteriota bacterium]|nr:MAG: menaquinol oxidoreductase [Candidatus Rokubacteria bacterium]PYN63185.1 MAG: menaquinol oxidoreductase [Candidatus Rokubacteria bacterium]